jgi:hypothetical protein
VTESCRVCAFFVRRSAWVEPTIVDDDKHNALPLKTMIEDQTVTFKHQITN